MGGIVEKIGDITLRPMVVNDPSRPAMLEALADLLRLLGPLSDKQTARLLQPTKPLQEKAEDTIKIARRIGLVGSVEGELLSLTTEWAGLTRPEMPVVVLRLVFVSPPLTEGECGGLESVFYAWLAASEAARGFGSDKAEGLEVTFSRELGLVGPEGMNKTKLNHFWDWADYVGLGRRLGGELGFVCDPTRAAEAVLDEVWPDGEAEADASFIATSLGSALSVLDGGRAFHLATRGRTHDRLSVAMTRALASLHKSKHIELVAASDAPSSLALAHGVIPGFDRIARIRRKGG